MPIHTFRINGTVSDIKTEQQVSGVRVEAWDKASEQHTVLGSGTTDAEGRFQIIADAELPTPTGVVVPATLKVFRGTEELTASGDTSIPDLYEFQRPAVLQVLIEQVEKQRRDLVTARQVSFTMNFIGESDFAGVLREGRDRSTAIGAVLMDSAKAAVMASASLKPLQPPGVRNRDVINQDSATARRRLEEQKVTVNSVQAYRPGIGALASIASIGRTINPGDRVDLLEENGVVKAFNFAKAPPASEPDKPPQTADLEQIKAELAALQKKAALVDQLQIEVAKLREQRAPKPFIEPRGSLLSRLHRWLSWLIGWPNGEDRPNVVEEGRQPVYQPTFPAPVAGGKAIQDQGQATAVSQAGITAQSILGFSQGTNVVLSKTMSDFIFDLVASKAPNAAAAMEAIDQQPATLITANSDLVEIRLDHSVTLNVSHDRPVADYDVAASLRRTAQGTFDLAVSGTSSSEGAQPFSFQVAGLTAREQGDSYVFSSGAEQSVRITPASGAGSAAEIEAFTEPYSASVPAAVRWLVPETVPVFSLRAKG